jgi:hypothetical protein
VAIEAKGGLDGNNTNIWDRPSWADEFVIWSLSPESMTNQPGKNAWSGLAVRLLTKLAAEHVGPDALIVFDGRCGSRLRPCPKEFGLVDGIRGRATDIPAQPGRDPDWLPPPCIFLMPRAAPDARSNREPRLHTLQTCQFADMLLDLFGVPQPRRVDYVHDAGVYGRGSDSGLEIMPWVTSRCWTDGRERIIEGAWKNVKRD